MWPSSAMARDAASTGCTSSQGSPSAAPQAFHVVAAMFECSTSAVAWNCAARVTDRARPGVVVALSVWWKKLARDGKSANELTNSDALTGLGRAPIFYDCLVEVAPL